MVTVKHRCVAKEILIWKIWKTAQRGVVQDPKPVSFSRLP
jgi:hypothetical protein